MILLASLGAGAATGVGTDAAISGSAEDARDVGFGGEYHATGLSPALVRGGGLAIELAAQSVPAFDPATGIAPVAPFLGFGGVFGRAVRGGVGAYGTFLAPVGGDLGFGGGAHAGVALGAGDRWFGFEADGAYVEAGDGGARLRSMNVGVDAVVGWDVDAYGVLFARLGAGLDHTQRDTVEPDEAWSWGMGPRAAVGAGYRPDPRLLVSAAVRAGRRAPGSDRSLPWTVGVAVAVRAGRAEPAPVVAATPAPVPAPAPAASVPKVTVAKHPELDCLHDTLSTGTPPPLGLEGWCVYVTADGRVVREGQYVRWSDPEHVAERGEYRDDVRVGVWREFAASGARIAEGNYADGLKDGPWKTWYPSGVAASDQQWLRGREDGVWRYYGEDGTLRVVGGWVSGLRDGTWVDYAPDGRPVRQRVYRDGRLMYEQLR